MKLSQLISKLDTILIHNFDDFEISNIQYDSRKCTPDSVFVALKGTQNDGYNFINEVISKGTNVIVCEKFNPEIINGNVTVIEVGNSRIALAQLSHEWFAYPTEKLKVIGITGTNGKTTITFLLKSIFEQAGFKTGIIGTTGIFVENEKIPATHTTPESLELCSHFAAMVEKGIDYVFMEVSSHALHQHRVHGVNFVAAALTNLTHEHLDYHKNLEDYALAKKILFDMLPVESFAIVCDNSEFSDLFLRDCHSKNKYFIGRTNKADIKISNEKLNISDSTFDLTLQNHFNTTLTTKLIGSFNIDNSSYSASLTILSGINPKIVQSSLSNAKGAAGRMQSLILKNKAVGIVDYAHTPDALEKALSACRSVLLESGKNDNRIICVFGCGGDRDKSKRPLMGKISTELADFSIITNDNPRTEHPDEIIAQIYWGIDSNTEKNSTAIPDRAEAIKYAVGLSKENDIILLAGKGHEDYQIIGKEKFHFDDIEELTKYTS